MRLSHSSFPKLGSILYVVLCAFPACHRSCTLYTLRPSNSQGTYLVSLLLSLPAESLIYFFRVILSLGACNRLLIARRYPVLQYSETTTPRHP